MMYNKDSQVGFSIQNVNMLTTIQHM